MGYIFESNLDVGTLDQVINRGLGCGSGSGNCGGTSGVKSKETGLARSFVKVNPLRHSAEEAMSTREGVTCLYPATALTPPWSVLEFTA